MGKKWTKPGHSDKRPESNPDPAQNCHYDTAVVRTVRMQATTEDEQWKSDQKAVWRKQLNRATCLNILSAVAAGAAIFYGAISYLQWRDSHHNFITDERAWITVAGTFPAISDLQTSLRKNMDMLLMANVDVRNTGKTIAESVVYDFDVGIPQSTEPVSITYDHPTTVGFVTLLGQNIPNILPIIKHDANQQEIPATRIQLEELIQGRRYIAVFGKGEYIDIFKEVHWFRFCKWQSYRLDYVYAAHGCTAYNSTGDGRLPEEKEAH